VYYLGIEECVIENIWATDWLLSVILQVSCRKLGLLRICGLRLFFIN
jgi:hypothetical protein